MSQEKLTPKQRMAIDRQAMVERDPTQRAREFEEVNLGLPEKVAMLEAKRCLGCKETKCIPGCPVVIDIPGFVQLVAEGKFLEAAHKVREQNSLPAITGRVCPQEEQCEVLCVLGKKMEPVAIGRLERFAADWEAAQGAVEFPET